MAAFTKAVYARLTGDTTLKGLLSTWKTKPAIFSDDPAPEDAAIPFVVNDDGSYLHKLNAKTLS